MRHGLLAFGSPFLLFVSVQQYRTHSRLVVAKSTDLFHTTHKVKTQQVDRIRGQRCGDFELTGYLANEEGPVPLVLDLHIVHDRFGSSTDPSINGHLHYPNVLDGSLNETAADKIRQYRPDYNNRPSNPISFKPVAVSGVQLAQLTSDQFHFRRTAFSSHLKSKVGNILVKDTTLRITLNIDGTTIDSKSHTYPSHSQTSRLIVSVFIFRCSSPSCSQCM